MKKKFLLKTISLLCAVLLPLCGCGKKNPAAKKNAAANEIKLQMQTVKTLNPITAENAAAREILSLCYEPLFETDASAQPAGVLAESISVSDDAKSAIIVLKDGVLWHNGKKLTAVDVEYTVNKIKSAESSVYADCVKYIESVTAASDNTVKIELSRPYAQLAHSLWFPVIPHSEENIEEKIVGTGAYREEEYISAAELRLTAFDKWHGGSAAIKNVCVYLMRDAQTAGAAFSSGVIDAATIREYNVYENALKNNMRTASIIGCQLEYMAFNHNCGFFSSANVRQAVSCAVNRTEIAQACYRGEAANSVLHPSLSALGASAATQYSIENAQELMFYDGYAVNSESGILTKENGETASFKIIVNKDNTVRADAAASIAAQLAEAGFSVTVEELDFDEYSRRISQGAFDAYLGGVCPANLLDWEFLLGKNGALNTYGYSSDYMEIALAALAAAPSETSIMQSAATIDEIFMREQPICTIAYMPELLLASDKIKGNLFPKMRSPYAGVYMWEN